MRRNHFACAVLLSVAGIVLAALAGGQNPPAAANDHVLRIAVVNAGRVYRNMREVQKFDQDRIARTNELRQEQGKRESEIQQLAAQQQQLKAGSAQWNELRDLIDQKTAQLDTWGKVEQLKLDRLRKANLKAAYDHVGQAAAAIAEQQHLDLVIADSSPEFTGPDLDRVPIAQLDQMLAARAVLFASKRADITEDVLTLVEMNFANQNKTASIPPATVPGH